MNFCTVSYVVKLIEKAIGPFIQFMVTPFKNPLIPCSLYKSTIVDFREGGLDGRSLEHPSDVSALSLLIPTSPTVCIRRRVTSMGYVTVWAISPANAPHCIRSIVVTSLPKIWLICHRGQIVRYGAINISINLPGAFLAR